MAATSIDTFNNIVNRVAVEVGFMPDPDPFASTKDHFVQMKYLLLTAGEELSLAAEWEFLKGKHQFTTTALDSGEYDLPSDFLYMINQTGWDRTNDVPLSGPLSDQQWTYLKGRDLINQSIYANFRFAVGKFELYPQPPPAGLDINYEYQRKTWIRDAASPTTNKEDFGAGGDLPLFNKTLISRSLKVKWLESKGFSTDSAQDDVDQIFGFLTGLDKGARIVNVGHRRKYPLLDGVRNVPDTGYGST